MKSLISECCGYALVVVVVLTSSTLIFAEEKGDDSAPEKGPPAETGFLFIDGQYVSPPYIFRTDESGVSVNGI